MEPSLRYLDLIPSELLELLVYPLNNDDLLNFIQFTNIQNVLWPRVFEYHFGYHKKVSKDGYTRYLNIERLKEKWKDVSKINKCTIDELVNLQQLNLAFHHVQEIPKEIGNLIRLQKLNLYVNRIRKIPKEISNLINLQELI